MTTLSLGKIPIDILTNTVLKMTGAKMEAVLTPPRAGLDFAAISVKGGTIIVSADPVTGVRDWIGGYAVNVSANDVATSGNRPQFAESVILLPEGASGASLREISRDVDAEARKLGIAIVGGHTEVTPGLRNPIVVLTVFSHAKRFVTAAGARSGDTIMMTKTAGIEGTVAIAELAGKSRTQIPAQLLNRARKFTEKMSVVEEAVAAYKTGHVRAMHDCTEGGVLGAVFEMSFAAGVGFEVREAKIPVAKVTRELCGRVKIDPLKLIGSGSLLLAVESGREEVVRGALEGTASVSEIGKFTARGRFLIHGNGSRSAMRSAPVDELWRLGPAP